MDEMQSIGKLLYKYRLLVTPKQMKTFEEESDKAGVSYERLMEKAGKELSKHIKTQFTEYKDSFSETPLVIFLCGNGNNAGDCFVAARRLKKRSIDSVVFLLCGEPKTELARLNFERMEDIKVIRDESEMLGILNEKRMKSIKVDGVFGTGFHGWLPENVKRIFKVCGFIDIAADVPSGGNCKTGAVADGTLYAKKTIAFGCAKIGMLQYPLRSLCGQIIIKDINIPEKVYGLIDYPIETLTGAEIPKRTPDSHKGNFGRLLTVCGSVNMPGAALMSACAAARSGVGLLEVCAPAEYVPHFAAKLPEAVYLPLETENGAYALNSYDKIIKSAEKASAVLIGCGLGVCGSTKNLVKKLIQNINCPIILDADGINCITDSIDIIRQTKREIILTPHPAEMARLCGTTAAEIQSDRFEYAKMFSQKYSCTLILKGAGTIIAYPDRAYVNTSGNPGMAKGGSGDVLSGIVASLAAQGIPSETGVFIHGRAGDAAAEKYSKQSMLPTDMIDELGGIFKKFE
ncbi:MAG: NAD(P)H-hydrate dehydratase [Clostridium sp.]|nr:NAD(P)H-hydrate dehydratase [Clostridium sp.]MCM1548088.1 NAD(P)H-hydrate dehydratase [Ruminococcus sp.]